MNRASFYLRYSDALLQRQSSIVDQQRRCQEYADKHGLQVVRIFADEGAKGWKRDRVQYQAMLSAAKLKQFDVLIVNDFSRLFRDSGEQDRALKRLRILSIRVVSIADGFDSTRPGAKLTAAFAGIINEQFSDMLADHTRRGQKGRILQGLSAGGDIYGYASEAIMERGRPIGYRRVIDKDEADVVRDIYADFAAGLSPAKIADSLNARGIPSPRGGAWGRNAIYGDRRDLSGILSNPIYRGEVVWNRSQFMRDSENSTRVKLRHNKDEWVRVPAPDLRIISDELAAEVDARFLRTERKGAAIRQALGDKARSGADGKYMLTGLLRCSSCGGPISSTARDTFGCSARHNRGEFACSNDVKFKRSAAELALLEAVRGQLFTPEAIDLFLDFVSEEQAQQAKAGQGTADQLRRKLDQVDQEIRNCLGFIRAGNSSSRVSDLLGQLETEEKDLRKRLAEAQADQGGTPSDLADLRRVALSALNDLPELLSAAPAQTREVLANLLGDSAVVTPAADKATLEIKMAGQLTGLLSISAAKRRGQDSKCGCAGKI